MIRDRKIADDGNNIIYIDKEKREFDNIQTYQDLNDYIGQHFQSDKHNYILIDEIQDIREFERSIRSFLTWGRRVPASVLPCWGSRPQHGNALNRRAFARQGIEP